MKTIMKTCLPFLTLLLFVGAAEAQSNGLPAPGMLPDHPLYLLKSTSEGLGTFFAFGELAEAERALDLAERRLAEAKALAEKGAAAAAERTLVRYEEQLDRALDRAAEAKTKGVDTDELSARASVATLGHQAVLAAVYERVPEPARPAIERAMAAGMRGHEESMNAISGQARAELVRGVERQRQQAGPAHERLRARGIPVPAVRTRQEVERGPPVRSGKGGRRGSARSEDQGG